MPSGSVLSKKKMSQFISGGLAESFGDKLRAECGTADADDEEVLERAFGAGDFAGVDIGGESFDGGVGVFDFLLDGFWVGARAGLRSQ